MAHVALNALDCYYGLNIPVCRTRHIRDNGMAEADNGKRRPPYPPYSQWQRLLKMLRDDFARQLLPSRIDGSYLKKLKVNPSAESNLQSALAFLGLVDGQRQPTDALKELLSREGDEAKGILRKIVEKSYKPVLDGLLPLTATPDHLAEKFKRGGAQDEVGRKGVTFYVRIAKEAGIALSAQFKTRERQPVTRTPRKRPPPSSPLSAAALEIRALEPTRAQVDTSPTSDMMTQLLAKFPDFDPSWDEQQVHLWRGSLAFLMAEVRSHPRTPQDGPPRSP